jgi:tetratricopeptide (TPR) repeat protein
LISISRGRHDQASAWAKRGLSLCDQIGDRQGVGTALNCLGMMSVVRWDLDGAAQYCRQNLALCEEIGDRVGTSRALNDLGEVARKQGDYEQARACYEDTLAISSETGDSEMHAIALINLGMVYLAQGEDSEAWGCLCDGLRESIAMQATPLTLYVLAVTAQLCVRGGEPQHAGELMGLVLHHPSTDAEALQEAQPALEALRKAMPAEELEAALARGAGLELEQVVTEILAQ